MTMSTLLGTALLGSEPHAVKELSPQTRELCLTVLREALAGPEFWPAMHAAEALTIAGHGDEVVPLLEARLLTDNDAQHRCGLAREIARTGRRDHIDLLWKTLADPQSGGRVHAAESLYKIGEVGDGKLLRTLMMEPGNPRMSIMCAAGLGRAGSHTSDGTSASLFEIRRSRTSKTSGLGFGTARVGQRHTGNSKVGGQRNRARYKIILCQCDGVLG